MPQNRIDLPGFMSKFVKGLMLLIWIILISSVTLLSAYRSTSSYFYDLVSQIKRDNMERFGKDTYFSPSHELRKFLRGYIDNPPPVESIMEAFMDSPSWTDRPLKIPAILNYDSKKLLNDKAISQKEAEKTRWLKYQYRRLFFKIDRRLNAIASNTAIDPGSVKYRATEFIPNYFSMTAQERAAEIVLPQDVLNWIVEQRSILSAKKARGTLIDTFVILMALGAFGSLIFLTRDYIQSHETTSIEAYIFRPFLGIFLAIAVFVVDLATHTVISSADILSIRYETLYILALAAGLFSEQVYVYIGTRVQQIIAERTGEEDEKADPDKGADGQS